MVNIFSLVGHTVPLANLQLCRYNIGGPRQYEMKEHGCGMVNLDLWKDAAPL